MTELADAVTRAPACGDIRSSRRRTLVAAGAGLCTWLCGCTSLGERAAEHEGEAAGAEDPPELPSDDSIGDSQHPPDLADTPDPDLWRRPRSLDLIRTQTGERLQICYWSDGELLGAPYRQLCDLLRDVRAARHVPIDPRLLDLLWALQAGARREGVGAPLHVLSAFRTLGTNRRSRGARDSLHTSGRAVDCRLPGMRATALARLARALQMGGVGSYPRRNAGGGWVHLDTGRVRNWTG